MDPKTALALFSTALQGGQQLLSNKESRKREAEYRGERAKQKRASEEARQRIANIDFSPGSGIYDLQQQRELQAELLGSEADRRGDEREARALAALQDSPRQMQALAPRIISQTEDAQQKADLQTGQMKVDARAATTKAEEDAADQTRRRDMMLDQMEMERANRSFDTFTEGMFGERAARAEGNRAFVSELGETAIALAGNLEKSGDDDNDDEDKEEDTDEDKEEDTDEDKQDTDEDFDAKREGGDPADRRAARRAERDKRRQQKAQQKAQKKAQITPTGGSGMGALQEMDDLEVELLKTAPYYTDAGQPVDPINDEMLQNRTLDTTNFTNTEFLLDILGEGAQGMFVPIEGGGGFVDYGDDFARGGTFIGKEGGITEGEFSHKTNKKAVIDQENGVKEAELTGGEGILNPEQFKNLESVKALIDKLAAMPSATAEIKKAAELLKFLEGEQFQDA